jgi:hypothetical protein
VTPGTLPYHASIPMGDHYEIAVVGIVGDAAWIDDERPQPRSLSMVDLAAARAYTRKRRHRLIEVTSPVIGPDLEAEIRRAIEKTCANLTGPVLGNNFDANFGFRGLEKLAFELRSPGRKGWQARFSHPERMFVVLQRLYTGIETEWGSTGGMRPLYADFLDEAATLFAADVLQESASLFRRAGVAWQRLAATALPVAVPGLGGIPEVLDRMQASTILATSHPSLGPSALDDLRADFAGSGGLGPTATRALFDRMAEIVEEILSIERPAVELLSAAMKR